jgi:hypothetical protein
MLRQLNRIFTTATVLLLLFASSSALGATRSHHERTVAARLHAHHHRAAARGGRDNASAVRQATAFLPSAVLLGEEGVQRYADGLSAGQAEAFPFQARASGVTAVAHVYIDSQNTATHLIVGLYSAAGGRPAALLTAGSLAFPLAGAWNAVPVADVGLTSGTSYWLAVLGTGGTLRYRDRLTGSCQGVTSAQTNLAALASAWRTGKSWWTCPVSAYVTANNPLVPVEPAPPLEEPKPPVETPPPAPTNMASPQVSGTPTEGHKLTASTGTWAGSPSSYAYQWQDCSSTGTRCANVSAASGSNYTLTAGDVGHTLRAMVTASNSSGSTAASSANTEVVAAEPPPPPPPPLAPVNSVLPVVSGSVVEGQTLSATTGTWSGSPTSYAYQWEDCSTSGEACANVSGATGSSYTLVSGDVGHTLRVAVTATNAGGSMQASSAATGVVAAEPPPPPLAPVNSVLPVVSGSVVEGQTLSATTGTWSGSPTSYAYQWEDCSTSGEACSNVSGATGSSYKLVSGDVGHTLRVAVTATNAGGSTQASSAATSVVEPEKVEETEAFTCSVEVAASEAAKLAEKIASVPGGGGTVCLKSGTFGFTTIKENLSHTGYVVVRPAKGATVIDQGFDIIDSKYIAIEHFGFASSLASNGSVMTEGVKIYGENKPGSKYVKVDYDIIEDPSCHSGHGCPGPEFGVYAGKSGTAIEHTQIAHDFMRHINFGGASAEQKCELGIGHGQAVTMENAEYTEIEHDVFYQVQAHYLQDGGHSTVENNLFIGGYELTENWCPSKSGIHVNIWQQWAGGEEDNVFSHNIVLGEDLTQFGPVATDAYLVENGSGGAHCEQYNTNQTIEGNLFVNSGGSWAFQVYYVAGLTRFKNNTSVYNGYGDGVGIEDSVHCGVGPAEITGNIDVETTGGQDLSFGCSGSPCLINENVAEDASSKGETTKVEKWKPSWESGKSCDTPKSGSCWDPYKEIEEGVRFPKPPVGYYVEKGLPFRAGYDGNGGPA